MDNQAIQILPVSLAQFLRAGPYQSYTYGYPHKTAYRPFEATALTDVWEGEKRDNLFLYLHIPFCEMRCGFCNLFTTVNAPQSLEQAYLDALERQARVVKSSLEGATFSRLAIGGGTPTYLAAPELERVFKLLKMMGADAKVLPTSVETSPATATPERLKVLADWGVNRVSIGIQSFVESEVYSVGRAQKNTQVHQALAHIRAAKIPILNIDLIYGLAHQTPETWLQSLNIALTYQPEELFLYPLYVRPLTGIGRLGRTWDDERLELYALGRDFLQANGYLQTSQRRFQKQTSELGTELLGTELLGTELLGTELLGTEPEYACQLDGMLGLGCGARSYTRHTHYSSEYAVGAVGVRDIISDFVARPDEDFSFVSHGIKLSSDERKRRFLLQSLLHFSGLEFALYAQEFGTNALNDFPQLAELVEGEYAAQTAQKLVLTPLGMAFSDAIGPWLYSDAVNALSADYAWR